MKPAYTGLRERPKGESPERPACSKYRNSGLPTAPRLLTVIIVFTSAIAVTCAICLAHSHVDEPGAVSWYPIECCHYGECRPAEMLKAGSGGEWFRTVDGVTILADHRAERRSSKDDRWHICIGSDDTEAPFVRCIFEPSSS